MPDERESPDRSGAVLAPVDDARARRHAATQARVREILQDPDMATMVAEAAELADTTTARQSYRRPRSRRKQEPPAADRLRAEYEQRLHASDAQA
jgi:hypothetical protein